MKGMTLGELGQLRAAANSHHIVFEWLRGSPPASLLGKAEAEFFGEPPQPVCLAA
jgi:hypothetical protein